MFCPNCAASIDGMKFCRQCGANVSLVPQALTGQLPAPTSANATPSVPYIEHFGRVGRKNKHLQNNQPPNMGDAIGTCVIGIGFLIAAFMVTRYFPGGFVWGWTFVFPAFGALSKGISQYYRARDYHQQIATYPAAQFNAPSAVSYVPAVNAPTTSELQLPAAAQPVSQPASVVEHTTALLDAARQKAAEKQ